VTGPDEYTALVDNNVYTNLMAARNLNLAADLAAQHPEDAERLGVDDAEIAAWRAAAVSVVIPYDEELGVHPQSEGFTHLRRWDFEKDNRYPLLLSAPYYSLYSSQVIKQADLVFALYLCSECFSPEQRARDFAYYEQITVRDSSLSAAIQAIVAADTGHVDLAHEYWAETALIDLRDLAGNTDSGVHLAALAGAWLVAVAGFGGMRDHGDVLSFAPRLAKRLERLAFRLLYRGRQLRVEIRDDHVSYELVDGEPIEILHEGSRITLAAGEARRCPTTPPPPVDGVTQPPGRAPARR
jgi:alpha,alpha-trehalose phosphorylase